ncbi:hypothetical protein GGX14DRAFT_564433 [Mycena pura]|uniref:Uncharacterized protein n=1 Tax=Mycena pura TaxID=153505 RepID=A0AAD6YEP3_9AGAR|nr:hypothetical protein GGX14DRAFT_564433 [Mycena pura]
MDQFNDEIVFLHAPAGPEFSPWPAAPGTSAHGAEYPDSGVPLDADTQSGSYYIGSLYVYLAMLIVLTGSRLCAPSALSLNTALPSTSRCLPAPDSSSVSSSSYYYRSRRMAPCSSFAPNVSLIPHYPLARQVRAPLHRSTPMYSSIIDTENCQTKAGVVRSSDFRVPQECGTVRCRARSAGPNVNPRIESRAIVRGSCCSPYPT